MTLDTYAHVLYIFCDGMVREFEVIWLNVVTEQERGNYEEMVDRLLINLHFIGDCVCM